MHNMLDVQLPDGVAAVEVAALRDEGGVLQAQVGERQLSLEL